MLQLSLCVLMIVSNSFEFPKTISWNEYRSEITAQSKINNLYYLIDLTF